MDAAGRAVSSGTGWLPDRSVGGWIVGLPDEVNAQVRIQRLPPAHNELYDVGPPLPTGPSSYYPPELTCLDEIDHLEPEETVAVVKMSNGRWGLSDHPLSSNRHLITIEAPGLRAKPAGYVAVVFGGAAPHQVWTVDLYVGASGAPSCA